MLRPVATAAFVCLAAAAAPADRLVLLDGRAFEGTVTVEAKTVRVEMAYGTLQFARSDVQRIEFKDTPETQLAKRLSHTSLDDPDAVFDVAAWAAAHELGERADELYALVLKLDADHAGARRALGFVRLQGRWMERDAALELARSKLEAGDLEVLRSDLLPKLRAAVPAGPDRRAVRELAALTRLRSKEFAAAQEAFAALAEDAEGPAALRFEAVAELLAANDDGMYVLDRPYPPAARLLGDAAGQIEAGPASLARPLVLEAALHDRARQEVEVGRELMASASKAERSEPPAARLQYFRANQAFDRAEALQPDIARSYRVEICRRRISGLRTRARDEAEAFDDELDALGERELSPTAYRSRLLQMKARLERLRRDLEAMLDIARPYPRDLVLEIGWAETDLDRVEKLRLALVEELHDAP